MPVVAPAPPPKDDGKPSKGGGAGTGHSAALEQLKSAELHKVFDKQNSVSIPLPDGERWTRVKFWGVPSLVGFRYGKEHHALVGMFVTPLLVVGAIRLSRPHAPWARWRYTSKPKKMHRALEHERRFRRPVVRAKLWLQDAVSGMPRFPDDAAVDAQLDREIHAAPAPARTPSRSAA